MDIYLPIAELPVNLFLVLGLGGAVGFLSGMFGVGGGFLMTPLLILLGVPAAVAVATQAPQILASSVSGVLAQFRRKAVDVKMGWVLVAGGLVGSFVGVSVFAWLKRLGHIDLFVSAAYVLFLGTVAALMLSESLGTLCAAAAPPPRRAAASTTGPTAGRSRCGSRPPASTSAPSCRSRSAPSAGCWPPSSASAAASS